jgi:hypothetical protein
MVTNGNIEIESGVKKWSKKFRIAGNKKGSAVEGLTGVAARADQTRSVRTWHTTTEHVLLE